MGQILERDTTLDSLKPVYGNALAVHFNITPNLRVRAGTLLALITAAAVTATYTITFSGSPTAGSFQLSYRGFATNNIAFSSTAATMRENIRKALIDLPGCKDGDFAVTGNGPYTITAAGELAGLPITAITVASQAITGGTVAAAAGVAGVAGGRYAVANETKVADPLANAVSYSSAGTGTFAAGPIYVQHTWETATGETLPSPAVKVTMTANQALRYAAITAGNTPDEAVALNVYISGIRVARVAVATPGAAGNVVTGDITDYNTATGADGKRLPSENLAFIMADGTHKASAIARYDFMSDHRGNVILGSDDKAGTPSDSIDCWLGGVFEASKIFGLTATAVSNLGGKLRVGGIGVAGSILDIPFTPAN
jgi:hypothetical protein